MEDVQFSLARIQVHLSCLQAADHVHMNCFVEK